MSVSHSPAQAVCNGLGGVVFFWREGGETVDEAAYLYTLMEKNCEGQSLVEAAATGGRRNILLG